MRRAELAKQLIAATNNRVRRQLLAQNRHLADVTLADNIRKTCYAAWTIEPIKARLAAAALKALWKINGIDEIKAASLWADGISQITKGKFENAASSLESAVVILKNIGNKSAAAQAQVARLLALAMIGRYDEAIRTGKMALKIFVGEGDDLAAGKIEMNLSNITARQARNRESEKYCLSARRRFINAGEKRWQAMAENDLANTYTELNDFKRAERFYRTALATARQEKMPVTEAEIEASLGNLALIRGRYAEALRFLESSRQRYESLGIAYQTAIADLEIADIYLELNLLAEAAEIYGRVSGIFRKLKLRAEEARSRLNHGRTAAKLGSGRTARRELKAAFTLYDRENNASGQAAAMLAQAQVANGEKHFDRALNILEKSAKMIAGDNSRQIIILKLLTGEALAETGDTSKAAAALAEAYEIARKSQQIDAAQTALNALGKLSIRRGDNVRAKAYFSKAVKLIENLRSPLAADEFSMAFLSSRLEPYENLANVLLGQGRIYEAFEVIERGRSRSLLDAVNTDATGSKAPIKPREQMGELRAELNFYYKKLERSSDDDSGKLRKVIHVAEANLAGVIRQISALARPQANKREPDRFDAKAVQQTLGTSRTLIEFIETDGEIAAFIVTQSKIEFVGALGSIAEINRLIEELYFQFGALRYSAGSVSRFIGQMKQRTDQCLMRIYDLVIRPLEKYLTGSHLILVPVGPLHYIPFHALNNGTAYVVENYETSYAPSAAVWAKLSERPVTKVRSALLMGYADERIPFVENEIRTIAKTLPNSKRVFGEKATFSRFADDAPKYDLIHLACHGQFRPDNPMFSSLHLADGWVTVQDICSRRLKSGLVTLSACETGLNKEFAGGELLGLARGFLSAGAASLVVSLWTVNDEAAGKLMSDFYSNLQRGDSVSASLRYSQLSFIGRGEHPFFWSPFIAIGQ